MTDNTAARVASRYIPKGATATEHPAGLGVVYCYGDGKPCAIAYRGTAGRSEWHTIYKTDDQRADHIRRWFAELTARQLSRDEYRARVKAERSKSLTDRVRETPPDKTLYLSCADTAAILRGELSRRWPSVRFSVRSSTYSGGASIDVTYTDGPALADVEKICNRLAGADFDGSIDLKTYRHHWITPDGAICDADSPGTQGSRGVIPSYRHDCPSPDARRVSMGADYIHARRDISPAFAARIADLTEQQTGTRLTVCPSHDGTAYFDTRAYSPEMEAARRHAWGLVNTLADEVQP
jgi:hypothetical protein